MPKLGLLVHSLWNRRPPKPVGELLLIFHVVRDEAPWIVAVFARDPRAHFSGGLQSWVRFHSRPPPTARAVSRVRARTARAGCSPAGCVRTCSHSRDADSSRLPESRSGGTRRVRDEARHLPGR